ncbi:MAG: hypothetical protein IT463_10215 [Planctomycetes bacterium]|nr:hypothetical protein [Planctomycetota bacterium]
MAQRRVSLLVVLVLLALALAAVALWPREGAHANAPAVCSPGESQAAVPDALEPPSRPVGAGNDALPLANAPVTAPSDCNVAAAAPATGSAAEDASGETLWVPVYGDAVQRSTARAEFALTDAQEQPLDREDVGVSLFRRVAGCWVEDEAYYDPGRRVVVCDGLSGGGLEPGEYELELRNIEYGWLRHRFSVLRGQQLAGALHLPNWRRILCVRFTDLDGNAIEWIDALPRVDVQAGSPPAEDRSSRPPVVLREPPQLEGSGEGGGTSRFARRRSSGTPGPDKYLTDGGAFYVPVMAGAENKVAFQFNVQLWGQSTVEFAGRFTERADDQVSATLTLAPDFAQRTEGWHKVLEDDPGQRSRLQWAERLTSPPPLEDPACVPRNYARFVLDLKAPAGIVPMYQRVASDLRMSSPIPEKYYVPVSVMRKRDSRWYADVFRGDKLRLAFGDGNLVLTECELIPSGTERVVVLSRSLEAASLAAPRWELPPTVDAWAAHRTLAVRGAEPPADDQEGPAADPETPDPQSKKERVHPVDYTFDGLRGGFAPTGRLPLLLQAGTAGQATWHLAPAARRGNDWNPNLPWCRWATGSAITAPLAANTAELNDVLAGRTLKACGVGEGLAFRVVGPRGEGLPFVEASLLPLENDALAQRLLAGEREVFKSGTVARPGATMPQEWFEKLKQAEAQTGQPAAGTPAAELIPEAMREHAGRPEDLLWFARNGAWYNSHARYFSDCHGYSVTPGAVLKPGRLYVLYVWSASRNDLQPDCRIVFRATSGMTDLGAVALPGYAD